MVLLMSTNLSTVYTHWSTIILNFNIKSPTGSTFCCCCWCCFLVTVVIVVVIVVLVIVVVVVVVVSEMFCPFVATDKPDGVATHELENKTRPTPKPMPENTYIGKHRCNLLATSCLSVLTSNFYFNYCSKCSHT